MTVLGGSGAYPVPDIGCSGYVVEADGCCLLIDPGYATLGELMRRMPVAAVDAVYVSHRHPDHCADLNPLLRARALGDDAVDPLPIYAPADALGPVLALDRPPMLDDAYELHEFAIGDSFDIGPLGAETRELPHFAPNAAVRVTHGDASLVYTGDGGPAAALIELAEGADLLVAEATHLDAVPADCDGLLCDVTAASRQATAAGVGRLVLTHLWPGDDPQAAMRLAARTYTGPVEVARPGVTVDLGRGACRAGC